MYSTSMLCIIQACQLEVIVMCKSIPPGKGNLYHCLFDHMNEPTMKSKVCCVRACVRVCVCVCVSREQILAHITGAII